jgi:hypothetical protein
MRRSRRCQEGWLRTARSATSAARTLHDKGSHSVGNRRVQRGTAISASTGNSRWRHADERNSSVQTCASITCRIKSPLLDIPSKAAVFQRESATSRSLAQFRQLRWWALHADQVESPTQSVQSRLAGWFESRPDRCASVSSTYIHQMNCSAGYAPSGTGIPELAVKFAAST